MNICFLFNIYSGFDYKVGLKPNLNTSYQVSITLMGALNVILSIKSSMMIVEHMSQRTSTSSPTIHNDSRLVQPCSTSSSSFNLPRTSYIKDTTFGQGGLHQDDSKRPLKLNRTSICGCVHVKQGRKPQNLVVLCMILVCTKETLL